MLSPYNLEETEEGYCFVTDFGNIYLLTFTNYPLLNDGLDFSVLSFSIDIVERNSTNSDNRIEITVCSAINRFFDENDYAIIFMLDNMDGKHHARKRLFDKWHGRSNNNGISKENFSFTTDGIEIITSLLIKDTNPFVEKIKNEFKDLCDINFFLE